MEEGFVIGWLKIPPSALVDTKAKASRMKYAVPRENELH